MSQMIFVNLPVTDLTGRGAFYEAIGAAQRAEIHRRDRGDDELFRQHLRHASDPRQFRQLHAASRSPMRKTSAGAAVPCRADSREAVDAIIDEA